MKHNPFYYFAHLDKTLISLLSKISPKFTLMQDRRSIESSYLQCTGKPLCVDNPHSYCEKLQWLKLYDRNPLYTQLVDKYKVKEWVADKLGEEYVIPTLHTYQSVNEIDIDTLPNSFVIKCNHDSGSTLICRNKLEFNLDEAKIRLANALRRNWYNISREWAYKDVKPLILVEPYLTNSQSSEYGFSKEVEDLWTYKFLCFNGVPKIMYVTVKNEDIWENYYDMDFKPLDIQRKYRRSKIDIPCPAKWIEMKEIATKLSKGIPHVRVDLYYADNQIFFSEMTFYDWAGFSPFPSNWEELLGEWIVLPNKYK